jgi:hypothetical protein
MILRLLKKQHEVFWIIFHILLGIASTNTPYVLVFWVLLLMGTAFLDLLLRGNKNQVMTMMLAYLMGVEVFSRVVRAPLTKLLPDEIGKYFPLYVLLAAFLVEGKLAKKSMGWWIIVLTIPSLFLIETWNLRYGIVFNYLGIFNLALLLIYFGRKELNVDQLNSMFQVGGIPRHQFGDLPNLKSTRLQHV